MKQKSSFTEQDLEAIFSGKNPHAARTIKFYIFPAIVFVVVVSAIFIILNFSAIKQVMSYWYKGEFGGKATEEAAPKTTLTTNNNSNINRIRVPKIDNNTLKIETLNLEAPITWRIKNEPDMVSQALKNGVIHIDGTALPGENGNVFITGHSSNFAWIAGSYNSVFALLNNLVTGDRIVLKYQDKYFIYSVSEKKIVSASDISVMNPTEKPTLTLMTCWPIGTSYKRLIIIADQTYPDTNLNEKQKSRSENRALPKVR